MGYYNKNEDTQSEYNRFCSTVRQGVIDYGEDFHGYASRYGISPSRRMQYMEEYQKYKADYDERMRPIREEQEYYKRMNDRKRLEKEISRAMGLTD